MVKKRRLSDKKEDQLQYEKLRDTQNRFVAERYDSDGFYYHFHRNPELYCVIRGEVTVTVDAADIDGRIKKTYKDFARKYNFPGFRKGKAPRPIIDNALGKDAVRASVADEVVNGLSPIAFDE